jgi:hypothetical protein
MCNRCPPQVEETPVVITISTNSKELVGRTFRSLTVDELAGISQYCEVDLGVIKVLHQIAELGDEGISTTEDTEEEETCSRCDQPEDECRCENCSICDATYDPENESCNCEECGRCGEYFYYVRECECWYCEECDEAFRGDDTCNCEWCYECGEYVRDCECTVRPHKAIALMRTRQICRQRQQKE